MQVVWSLEYRFGKKKTGFLLVFLITNPDRFQILTGIIELCFFLISKLHTSGGSWLLNARPHSLRPFLTLEPMTSLSTLVLQVKEVPFELELISNWKYWFMSWFLIEHEEASFLGFWKKLYVCLYRHIFL